MKLAIVGSRQFPQIELVAAYIETLPLETEIVSGGALGVDYTAGLIARKRGMKFTVFEAHWEQLGKSAGMIRNGEIVAYADKIVAFWDGTSRGTKNTIERAKAAGKLLEVIMPKK